MKIGIITQPLIDNYGGVLQNYALQKMLIQMGHTPFTYDLCYRWPLWKWTLSVIRLYIKKLIDKRNTIDYPVRPYKGYIRGKNFGAFIKRNIHTVRPKDGIRSAVLDKYPVDGLIVGSDQVWRPMYNKPDSCTPLDNSFLEFASNQQHLLRVSYAASFGVDDWEYSIEQTQKYKHLLALFDHVSVREESGQALCSRYFGRKDVSVVPDPTFLLTPEDYRSLYEKNSRQICGNKFFFAGILDISEFEKNILKKIGKELMLDVVFTDPRSHTPEEWLRLIDEADFVVTDSFHCTVFSLIFGKAFLLKPSIQRGCSRYETIFEMFKINPENHIIDSYSVISDESINRARKKYKLEKAREKARDYLAGIF